MKSKKQKSVKRINKKQKIAIVYKGKSPESDISVASAKAVEGVLKKLSYPYFFVEADKNLQKNLTIKKPDLAFLAVHGMYGEDGCVQSVCELLSLPYTGSGVLTSALCMDKLFFKKILQKYKIATPDFQEVRSQGIYKKISTYPVVVKASHGGSSLGTYIVKNEKSLKLAIQKAKKIGRTVFIEDYISSGKEIAVSYLDGKILTAVEIVAKGGVYDYKRKYQKGQSQYHTPARLDPALTKKIERLSKKIFSLANVRSYARVDFLIQNNKIPWLLEVNTLPGLTKTSLLPKSASHDGITFPQLIETIIKLATTDYKQIEPPQ